MNDAWGLLATLFTAFGFVVVLGAIYYFRRLRKNKL